ncbi:MAG TPA: hypothetical protein PKB10_01845, partial [Tepidisphaeraceae bacterium]|nr:hypothetical protein [Tepidisphaeraceae bacterium]
MKQLIVVVGASMLMLGCNSTAEQPACRDRDRYALELADAQKSQREQKATIDRLQSDLKSAQEQLAQAQAQLRDAESKVADVQKTSEGKDQQLSELASLRVRVDELQRENVRLNDEVRALQARAAARPAAPATGP